MKFKHILVLIYTIILSLFLLLFFMAIVPLKILIQKIETQLYQGARYLDKINEKL